MALRAVIDHPKFARLKMLLRSTKGPTLGYLEALWHFTGRYTPQGNIGKYSDEEIEAWIEWEGEPGALIAALLKAGWVDASEEHRLIVHDYHQHADDAAKLANKRSGCDFVTRREVPAVTKGAIVGAVSGESSDTSLYSRDSVPTVSGLPEPVPEPVPGSEPVPELEKFTQNAGASADDQPFGRKFEEDFPGGLDAEARILAEPGDSKVHLPPVRDDGASLSRSPTPSGIHRGSPESATGILEVLAKLGSEYESAEILAEAAKWDRFMAAEIQWNRAKPLAIDDEAVHFAKFEPALIFEAISLAWRSKHRFIRPELARIPRPEKAFSGPLAVFEHLPDRLKTPQVREALREFEEYGRQKPLMPWVPMTVLAKAKEWDKPVIDAGVLVEAVAFCIREGLPSIYPDRILNQRRRDGGKGGVAKDAVEFRKDPMEREDYIRKVDPALGLDELGREQMRRWDFKKNEWFDEVKWREERGQLSRATA
jgi:hypothetical protein